MKTNRRDLLTNAALGGLGASTLGLGACSPNESTAAETDAISEKITARTIAEAEKLMGLTYTPNERQMMLSGLEGGLEALTRLHAMDLPNSLAPATTFEPKLRGRRYPSQKNTLTLSGQYQADLPQDRFDIAFATIAQQGAWLRSGAITSLALTNIYLERIERFAPKLECFVTVMADHAREQASAADKALADGRDRGPLHGIPYALKDLADVENGRTSWGATPYKDRIATKDAAIVHRLDRAGAVLLGKTTLGALAYGDIWFDGKTRNPWNVEEGSSGSSAGSASALAAGLCSFSIGTETLGSIVSPSERCGVTGLRPTFGRISRAGMMALSWSFDKAGPLCRSVEDTAIVLSKLNGYDQNDPGTGRHGFTYDGTIDIASMTVGYVPEWFENGDDVDRAALEAMRALGVTLKPFAFPAVNFESVIAPVLVESAAAFSELTLSNRDDDLVWQSPNAWPNTWRQARFTSAVDYIQIDRVRRQLMIAMGDAFDGFDALIGPHYAGGALLATNATGHPQLAMRAGFAQLPTRGDDEASTSEQAAITHRVPRGISLWSDLFKEGNIIALGHALEGTLSVSHERPVVFGR